MANLPGLLTILVWFLATCSATLLAILVLRPLAIAAGLVDLPDARKTHRGAVPLVGGIGIFLVVACVYLLPAAMGTFIVDERVASFFTGALLLVVVGAIDDYTELSSLVRFAAQTAAALIMVYGGGVILADVGALLPDGDIMSLGVLAVPFTIFATLGVINALNMSDGLDGLSSSLALISMTGLMIAVSRGGNPVDAVLLILLAGSVFGFWLLNYRLPGRDRAIVFMGDAGSMFLGYALTWFAIRSSQGAERVITPSAALWFLMVPIFDTVSMMLRRLVRGRSPFSPDREHLHHIFLLAGFSVNDTVKMMAAAALIGTGIGLTTMDLELPEFWVSGSFLIVGLLYFWMVMRSWKVLRFLDRSICRRRTRADRRAGADRRRACHTIEGPERRCGTERRQRDRRSMAVESSPAQAVPAAVRK
jgi:UDP-GlcNAc:undecaprenyl-phosphate GlcNAc-1-phosphate transferase